MGAYVVMLHEEGPDASVTLRERIEKRFPGSERYKFSDHVYLVTGPLLVSEVLEKLGIDDDEDLYAAVLPLKGSYSGRSWVELWDWMKATDQARCLKARSSNRIPKF